MTPGAPPPALRRSAAIATALSASSTSRPAFVASPARFHSATTHGGLGASEVITALVFASVAASGTRIANVASAMPIGSAGNARCASSARPASGGYSIASGVGARTLGAMAARTRQHRRSGSTSHRGGDFLLETDACEEARLRIDGACRDARRDVAPVAEDRAHAADDHARAMDDRGFLVPSERTRADLDGDAAFVSALDPPARPVVSKRRGEAARDVRIDEIVRLGAHLRSPTELQELRGLLEPELAGSMRRGCRRGAGRARRSASPRQTESAAGSSVNHMVAALPVWVRRSAGGAWASAARSDEVGAVTLSSSRSPVLTRASLARR